MNKEEQIKKLGEIEYQLLLALECKTPDIDRPDKIDELVLETLKNLKEAKEILRKS